VLPRRFTVSPTLGVRALVMSWLPTVPEMVTDVVV
jgi:hypothetical protein